MVGAARHGWAALAADVALGPPPTVFWALALTSRAVNRVFVALLVLAVASALAQDLLPSSVTQRFFPPRPRPAICPSVVVVVEGPVRSAPNEGADILRTVPPGVLLRRLGGRAGAAGGSEWHEVALGAAKNGATGFVAGATAACPRSSAMKALTHKLLDAANEAAKLALGLVGVLALWTGLMRVAEKAGLVASLARALRPLLVRLFPEVPPDHPAMGAVVMNMAANLLGLGNAATPLGLQAMKHLQELNPAKKTASNAMVLFLALNTTHLTLVPARTMAMRLEYGSNEPANIVLPTLLATACGMFVAVVVTKLLQRRFPVEAGPGAGPRHDHQGGEG
jgi:spore maturation protein A